MPNSASAWEARPPHPQAPRLGDGTTSDVMKANLHGKKAKSEIREIRIEKVTTTVRRALNA
jgi:hypothetical protein